MSDPQLFFTRAALEACAGDLRNRTCLGAANKDAPATDPEHLAWMLNTVVEQAWNWPVDKLGRWLGFVQGVLASRGELDVEDERKRSRDVYRTAYGSDGLKVPETL